MQQHINTPLDHNEAGASLIEGLFWLALFAVVIVIATLGFRVAMGSMDKSNHYKDILTLRATVKGMYAGKNNYGTAVMDSAIITQRAAPTSMISGTTLVNPWNGQISVQGNGTTFTIADNAVPAEDCADNVAKGDSSVWSSITINGAAVTLPADPVAVANQCTAATNAIVYTSN